MTTAKVSEDVNANADLVFAKLGDFAGIEGELIKSKKITGSGIGCLREITLANGARVVERLDNQDPNSRTQTYSIQNDDHPLPFKAYVATLIVTPTAANQCRVDWFSNFDVKSGTEAEAITFAKGIYTGMIKSVRQQLAT
ncbi:MAG: SRPBCC family protein [Alphaproteobacteria bacterium]